MREARGRRGGRGGARERGRGVGGPPSGLLEAVRPELLTGEGTISQVMHQYCI